jgi:hypothetical protein
MIMGDNQNIKSRTNRGRDRKIHVAEFTSTN